MYRSVRYTVAAIATTLGVSRVSIYRHLTRADSRTWQQAGQRGPWLSAEVRPQCSNAQPRRAPCGGSDPPADRRSGPGKTDTAVGRFQSYLSVWSSISASGALRFTDSIPLIALALLS